MKENFCNMSIVIVFIKKTFANLVIRLCIVSFFKEIIQGNVCKILKIGKHFLSQTIPDIQYYSSLPYILACLL